VSIDPRRRRVLFIGESITLSHVVRPYVLLTMLDPEQWEIWFAFDPKYRALLALPAHVNDIALSSKMARKSLERVALMQEEFYDVGTLEQYIREDIRLLQRLRPDVVVGDMRQSLIISSRRCGIPFVNIQSAHWHPWSDTQFHSPVNPFAALLPNPLASTLFDAVMVVSQPLATLGQSLLCLKYAVGVPGLTIKHVLSDGDYLVFPDIPEWSSFAEAPNNAAFVGPLLWTPEVAQPAWWDRLPRGRAVVYVGLGSSGQVRLLQMIIDVLSEFPVDLIVSTAGRMKLEQLPDQAYGAEFIDGAAAARMARLTLCNGGSQSVPQALAEGCPVLAVTSNIDQAGFMTRIEALGAGHALMESSINKENLRKTLARMLADPAYKTAAERLGASIRQLDGARSFEEILLRAARDRQGRAPTSEHQGGFDPAAIPARADIGSSAVPEHHDGIY
jgi:UDP:flavonoid glycosyltransferase YjiC (YdhE family)